MKLSESSFALCHAFLTSCVIISYSVVWSSLLFKSAYAENTDKTNLSILSKDDVNDLSHTLPYLESRSFHSWQMKNKYPIVTSLTGVPIEYSKHNLHFNPKWFNSAKRQASEEMPPPGFVGARGRRMYSEYVKGRHNPTDGYKALNEVFPNLFSHLRNEQVDGSTDQLIAARLASGKKSDSIVYKDGFLGVRG